jgi:hypothetical protein
MRGKKMIVDVKLARFIIKPQINMLVVNGIWTMLFVETKI